MTRLSKRAKEYVAYSRAAMNQRPVGLTKTEVGEVMGSFHHCPTPDVFMRALVRRLESKREQV